MTDGLSRAGFDIDLLEGKAREEAFAYVLTRARVEHKRDFRAGETGNFFLEFKQKGRPSGIQTTEADWWAIEFQENRWLIVETEALKDLGRRAYKVRGSVPGGDHNNYEGVLIPLTWFYGHGAVQAADEADTDNELVERLREEVWAA